MQRRSFLAALGAAPFGLTLTDVMVAAPDSWATGLVAVRVQAPWPTGYQDVGTDMPTYEIEVDGVFLSALRSAFYQNNPARYEVGGVRCHHLFDDDNLIQRHNVNEKGITHHGVFVRTDEFVTSTIAGRPLRATLGTASPGMEPATSPDSIDVANTNLVTRGDGMLAP